jgi:predicted enzyme related to lactoylglutathione lyase
MDGSKTYPKFVQKVSHVATQQQFTGLFPEASSSLLYCKWPRKRCACTRSALRFAPHTPPTDPIMDKVVHFEIPTDDHPRAKRFYGDVFGWELRDMPAGGDIYTFAMTTPMDGDMQHTESGAINGGMFQRSPQLPISSPVITIGVDSIDEHMPRIEAAGGVMIVPKGEVPGMGYYAYFKDTEGNLMGLWESVKR